MEGEDDEFDDEAFDEESDEDEAPAPAKKQVARPETKGSAYDSAYDDDDDFEDYHWNAEDNAYEDDFEESRASSKETDKESVPSKKLSPTASSATEDLSVKAPKNDSKESQPQVKAHAPADPEDDEEEDFGGSEAFEEESEADELPAPFAAGSKASSSESPKVDIKQPQRPLEVRATVEPEEEKQEDDFDDEAFEEESEADDAPITSAAENEEDFEKAEVAEGGNEEADRLHKESADAAERVRQEEEADRQREREEAEAAQREKEEADRLHKESADAAERVRQEKEEADRQREREEAEAAQREKEEADRLLKESVDAAERVRQEKEEADRQRETEEAEHGGLKAIFRPGRLGLDVCTLSGRVQSVLEDSQAGQKGILSNMYIHEIEGQAYCAKLMKEKMAGSEDYEVIFLSQAEGERLIKEADDAAERAREQDEADRQRERDEAEVAQRENEEAERLQKDADEAAERAREEQEEADRQRERDEAEAAQIEAEEAERLKKEANEAADRVREEQEEADRQRERDEAEVAQRENEEAERLQKEADEAAERAREEQEEADRQRERDEAYRLQEEADEAAERARQEEEADSQALVGSDFEDEEAESQRDSEDAKSQKDQEEAEVPQRADEADGLQNEADEVAERVQEEAEEENEDEAEVAEKEEEAEGLPEVVERVREEEEVEDEEDEGKATAVGNFGRPVPLDDLTAEETEEDKAMGAEPEVAVVRRPNTRALNMGEEGEDDDEDDDPIEVNVFTEDAQRQGLHGFLGMSHRSSSAPSLAGSLAVARRRIPSHLTAPKRKARRKLPPPETGQQWDERHQLGGVENHLLPKRLRVYFSKPQTVEELKDDLSRRKHMTSLLKRLDQEEVPPTYPTPLSTDSGPPAIPSKHEFGGLMKDRDNQVRPWNNRWSEGIGSLNDGMHPSHRQYFSRDSLFAEAPSQRWRRYLDVEVTRDYSKGPARWIPIKENRPKRFPPMGL